jgi:agmatine deiminase
VNRVRLEQMTDQDGNPLRVVPLPMPAPLHFAGRRLPASYANFYIGNEAVLVPTFNDERDRHALETLAALFPTRRVVGIHAVDLVWGLGTLHCMTQQEPA